MAYTNLMLVAFCKNVQKLPTKYMWGTYGNKITDSLISAKKKQYPTKYSESRVNLLKSKIGSTFGCDCSGLIKWFLMTNGGKSLTPKYRGAYDLGTNGLYNAAPQKGKINTLPEIPGLAVYKKGHVGIYIGNGKVIECTLSKRGDGVVYSDLKDYDWTHWLKIPNIKYVETEKKTIKVGDRVKIKGVKYATGEVIPPWVKKKTHLVSRINGNRVLLGNPVGINSWVYLTDITL